MSAKQKKQSRDKILERRIDYIKSILPKPFADSEAEESSDEEQTSGLHNNGEEQHNTSLTILEPVDEQLIFEDIADAPTEIWTLDVSVPDLGTSSSPSAVVMNTSLPEVSCISPPSSTAITIQSSSFVATDNQKPKRRASSIGRASKRLTETVEERPHPKTAKKPIQKQFKWRKSHFEGEATITDHEFTHPERHETPYQYFKYFFDDVLIDIIVQNTNLYSTQVSGKCLGINKYDLMDFLAIELLMGVVQMPSYTDYWSGNLRFEKIANIMPLKRYQSIRRFLHFANNENMNDDRYFKIRPILEHLRQKCISLEQEKKNSIDEMMIPYKGTRAGSRRQYMKNKPTKWGFKLYVRAGISGIIYDFIIYGGDDTFRNNVLTDEVQQLGFGSKVVVALCQSIHNKPGSVVYFDNFFTSLELMHYLRYELGIFSLGTIRSNRLRGCDLLADKDLKKKGRGSYDYRVDNEMNVSIVKWFDNKPVHLCSTYVAAEPISTINRYSSEEKKRIDIPCPQIVKDYNQHMGGVDLADMLVALYRTGLRSHKWYLGIFSQLLDISVNNSWLLSRRHHALLQIAGKHDILKEFRTSIAQSLMLYGRRKRSAKLDQVPRPEKIIKAPKTVRPASDVRYDSTDHFAIFATRGRCMHCPNGQTNVTCTKCQLRLCFTEKRNCFLLFHKQK